jgi:hypothetical protein
MSMFRSLTVVAWLILIAAASITTAAAEEADFGSAVNSTVPLNEQVLQRIDHALTLGDVDALKQAAWSALPTARQLERQLGEALSLAPDDSGRSRIEAILTHTQAAIDALDLTSGEVGIDAARGRVIQARGEFNEGLDELRPFAVTVPVAPAPRPAVLPQAGSIVGSEQAISAALAGATLIALGATLRRQPAIVWWRRPRAGLLHPELEARTHATRR